MFNYKWLKDPIGLGAGLGGLGGGGGAGGATDKLPVNNPFKWNSGFSSGNDPNTYAFGINDKLSGETGSRAAAEKQRQAWETSSNAREGQQDIADATLMGQMRQYVDQAKAGMTGSKQRWDEQQAGLERDLEAAHNDASTTYTNEIQPRMKGLMEQAQKNTAGAMSLQEAMDPNNRVAKATRDLYEKQAQGEGRQGLADAGILQAMGMQNMAGQLGNVPMTGGQLQALMGANQAQSGAAYANTQRRIQDLRDQGLTQGFNRSDVAYGQGLDAQDRYRRSVGDYEGAAGRHQAQEQDYRNEYENRANRRYDTDRGYLQDQFGLDSGFGSLQHQLASNKTARGEALDTRIYGNAIQQKNAEAAAAAARQNSREQALGGLVSTAFGAWGGAGKAAGGGTGQGGAQADYTGDVNSGGAANVADSGYDGGYGGYSLADQMNYQQNPKSNPNFAWRR